MKTACRTVSFWSILGSSLLLLGAVPTSIAAEPQPPGVTRHLTPEGIEYGLWNRVSQKPAPVLLVLASDIDTTLGRATYRQCGNELAEHGWLCVSLDLPCHGKQVSKSSPTGLSGWSARWANNEDIITEFNRRLAQVVNHLIATGVADGQRIAACGTSRGGFLALHYAASDPRVKCVAAFAPMTEPAVVNEFVANAQHPLVKRSSVENVAGQLAGRPIWIVIGDQDERVGTDQAIRFARKLAAVAKTKNVQNQTQLHVIPEPRGHTTPRGSSGKAADWIKQQFPEVQPTSTKLPTKDRNLLLVDDHHVLYRSGTQRVFHPATVNPSNPVVREDRAWEMAIGWTSIIRHPQSGRYQLWYQAYAGGRDARKSHKCVVCYAESTDGVVFSKKPLGIHDFRTARQPWATAGSREKTEARTPPLESLQDSEAEPKSIPEAVILPSNIVLLGGNGYGDRYANSVLFEPHEPDDSKRYKMLYTDFSRDASDPLHREWPGFHAAFSRDGIHWVNAQQNPLNRTAYGGRGLQPPFADEDVYMEAFDKRKNFLRKTWKIPLSMSDAADVMFDPKRNKYVAYGKAWIQGPAGGLAWKHAMARVESVDFLHWSKPQLIASPDDLDAPNTEFHTSPVFYHDDCYFCLNQILSARGEAVGAKADAMHIELMISRDGIRWERPFRDTKFIDGAQQAFSNGGIFTNSTPVILPDEMRFYYGGYNSGAIGGGQRLTDPSQQSGVGFATLRRDRFAGIRPVAISAQSTLKRPLENIGQVTLKPVELKGVRQIFVNADASMGPVRVELLNEDGYRVRGFSKEDSIPLSGNSLRHPVKWKGSALSDLPPGRYLLRLHLQQAEVFAIRLGSAT